MVFSRFAVFVFCALLWAAPAHAFETEAQEPSQIAALKVSGEAFMPIAKDFGCPVFTWAGFNDKAFRTAQLEYTPEGHDVKNWTRLQTTTVYALTGRADADTEIMTGLAQLLVGNYKKSAEVIDLQYFENGIGEPAFYIEYKIGEGDAREHNAGVFMRTSDKAAAFMQIQARKGELPRKDTYILLGYLGMAPKGADVKRAAAPETKDKEPSIALPRRKPVLPAAAATVDADMPALPDISQLPAIQSIPAMPVLPSGLNAP